MFGKVVLAAALLMPSSSAIAQAPARPMSDVSIAMDFLGALGRLDFDTAASLLDKDVTLDLPYAGESGLIVHGRADVMKFFRRSMGKSVTGIVYKLDRAYPGLHGDATVLEVSTQGRSSTGRDYTNRLVGVFLFRDRRILLFREYFNPAKLG